MASKSPTRVATASIRSRNVKAAVALFTLKEQSMAVTAATPATANAI